VLVKSEQKRQDVHKFGQQFFNQFSTNLQGGITLVFIVLWVGKVQVFTLKTLFIEGHVTLSNWSKSS